MQYTASRPRGEETFVVAICTPRGDHNSEIPQYLVLQKKALTARIAARREARPTHAARGSVTGRANLRRRMSRQAKGLYPD